MADLSGLDRLWLGLLRAPVSIWARPHVLPEDLRARFAQRERPICYVLNEFGVADLVVLEKVCAAHGLPSPLQALKTTAAVAVRVVPRTSRRLLGRSHRLPDFRFHADAGRGCVRRSDARCRPGAGHGVVGSRAGSQRVVVANFAVGELGARRALSPHAVHHGEWPQSVRAVRRAFVVAHGGE